MAFLKVEQGSCPGQIIELQDERVLLGRHPNCQIVLDNAAVSRHHAQILESHGTFYLEDLRSRNLTFLNDKQVHGRIRLNHADQIKLCDITLRFYLKAPPLEDSTFLGKPGELDENSSVGSFSESPSKPSSLFPEIELVSRKTHHMPEPENSFDGSSVISSINIDSSHHLRIDLKPEAKLQAILSLSRSLNKVLKREDVLQAILDSLFTIFPPADEGFILLKNSAKNKLFVQATKQRHQKKGEEGAVGISMTVIQQAVDQHDAILSADATGDERFQESESLTDLRIRSVMCVPLVDKSNELLGVIQLNTKSIQREFTSEDLDVLTAVASQASLAIENAAIHEELLQQRDMQRDMEFATQVQLGFLPSQPPQVSGYEFHDYYEAALRVGGDYFDYITLPDGRLAITLGDVAGKGVPAALLMVRLFSSARYQLLTQPTPSAAIAALNAEIATSGLGHRFITCIFVVLNPTTNEVTIVNAGHMAPLLRGDNQTVEMIAQDRSGLPLGILPDEQFQETTLSLNLGDTIVIYTDGITEAMNTANEIYGRQRLIDYLKESPLPVEELVNGIVSAVEDYSVDRIHRDDICVVGLRRVK